MTLDEFNALIEAAYEAAFEYEERLTSEYQKAFRRASLSSSAKFKAHVVTASFVSPPLDQLSTSMNQVEEEEVNRIRDEAAAAIATALAAIGLTAVAASFMQTIALRGQLNFEQEITKTIRNIVQRGLDEGWTADQTALQLAEAFKGVSSPTAQMLAQTELTTLVNERSLEAAQKQFQDRTGPVYKVWQTMKDPRVRPAHATTQSQTVPIAQPFNVGGYLMMYPGDPSAPLQLTARCRCRMTYSETLTASAKEDSVSTVESTYTVVDAEGNDVTSAFQFEMSTSGVPLQWTLTPSSALPVGEYYFHPNEGTYIGLPYDVTTNPFTTITISTDDAAETEEAEGETPVMADGPAWRALLAIEEVATEDGRMLAEGSLTWRDLPLSLTAMDTSMHGAEGEAKVAGRIDRIWRSEENPLEVWGEGVFNSDEFGLHIAELVSNQSLRGNSIEPAVTAYEIRNRETGEVLEGDAIYDALLEDVPLLTVFLEAVIMCSTVVATPAIADANIVLASGVLKTSFFTPFPEIVEQSFLTAAAAGMAPLHPPLSWFEDPKFMGPTPLTVTPEGRVMGHAALWNSCHIGEPSGPGICVPPPRSGMQYEIFHHGVCTTDEGVDVPCGQITMSTFHAGRDLSWKATLEHYEHSGCAVADVIAGEDMYGIWVSGGLRPDLPAERVREMKAGALSGDWRQVIGRGLEFLAALVVNIPGFPIPRPEARIVASAAGEEEVLALVAAGMVTEEDVEGMSRREYLRKIESLTS